jgi:Peptidase family M28
MRARIALSLLLASAAPAAAQGAPAVLGSDSLRAVVEALAHDSLAGRGTPSPGLTKAANYLAAGFQRAGLEPGGPSGAYTWGFPLTVSALEPGRAYIQVGGGRRWLYGHDWRWAGGAGARPPMGTLRGPVVVVRGPVDSAAVARLPLEGRIVVYDIANTPDGRIDPAGYRNVFPMIAQAPLAILVGAERSDTSWARIRQDTAGHKRAALPAWPEYERTSPRGAGTIAFLPILEVSDSLLRPLLADEMRELGAGVRYAEPGVQAEIGLERRIEGVEWAPNVVAVLPGTDPVLRHEYVLYSAHVDGLGREPGGRGPDDILNGADDNASGTAVILQLAKAFAAGGRPRRSIVFVATGGEEIGLTGSHYLASRLELWNGRVVANVNIDMVGGANGRLFVVRSDDALRGAQDAAAARVGGALRILGREDIEREWPNQGLGSRSDHVNFIAAGIPSIHLFTGLNERYHTVDDEADAVDYAGLASIAEFAWWLGRSLAY